MLILGCRKSRPFLLSEYKVTTQKKLLQDIFLQENFLKEREKKEKLFIGVRGKAPKARQTTDGGVLRLRLSEAKNPRANCINKTKPRKGDRTYNVLNSNMFRSLSPRWGFFGCRTTTGG